MVIFVLVTFMGVGNAGSQTLLRSIQGDLFDETEVGTALSAGKIHTTTILTTTLTTTLTAILTTIAFVRAGSVSGSSCQVIGYLAGPLLPFQTKAYVLLMMWCTAGLGAALASRR